MKKRGNFLESGAIAGIGLLIMVVLGGLGWAFLTNSTPKPAGPFTFNPAQPSPTATAQEITSSMGDTLVGYDYTVTVEEMDHSDIFNDQMVASQDHTFRAYYVTMESSSPTGLEANPRYWRLFDDRTPAYPEVYAGKDPSLVTNKHLTRGEKEQGWVTFEIPQRNQQLPAGLRHSKYPHKGQFCL